MMNFVSDNPALPSMVWSAYALRGMWLVVLLMLLFRFTQPRSRKLQVVFASLLALWCVLPGAYSPTYWLGLAFMHPSWMSVALCAAWLYGYVMQPRMNPVSSALLRVQNLFVASGIVLGWVLMADMLAWLPLAQSVYALGFSSWAVGVFCVLAIVPWLVWGAQLLQPQATGVSPLALLVLVLTAFVFSRLPTGNVWDALLDPWLWFVLHFVAVRRCGHALRRYYSNKYPNRNNHEPT